MPDLTDNHEYKLPRRGEADWDVPLNENIERFDTGIEIRDVIGNRTNYEPKDGAKYYATDTGETLIGDGSEWQDIESTGKTPVVNNIILDQTIGDEWASFDQRIEPDERAYKRTTVHPSDSSFEYRTIEEYDDASDMWTFKHFGDEWEFDTLQSMGDGNVGISLASHVLPEAPLHVGSDNNWDLADSEGDFKIGKGGYRLKVGVATGGAGAGIARIRSQGGQNRLILGGGTNDVLDIGTDGATVQGDLDVEGNKNFVHSVDTDEGEREVVYTASEAGTPHTEVSGVAELADGRAEVDLPEHFAWVTAADEPLVVQLTPYGGTAGTKVVERSTDRIVVEDLDGDGDYEVAYTVKGTREGQATKEVVREPSPPVDADRGGPTPADD